MAAAAGNEMLIKIGGADSSVAFTTIGGWKTNRLVINESEIDVTTKGTDDPRWRELLAGGAPLSIEMSGSGVFKDSAAEATLLTAKTSPGSHYFHQFLAPGYNTFTGRFMISQLEMSGDDDGAVQFSATFMSAGTITIASV